MGFLNVKLISNFTDYLSFVSDAGLISSLPWKLERMIMLNWSKTTTNIEGNMTERLQTRNDQLTYKNTDKILSSWLDIQFPKTATETKMEITKYLG